MTAATDIMASSTISNRDWIFEARTLEQCERYEDMVEVMMDHIQQLPDAEKLDVEARNLLSVGFKNVVGSKRQSFRVISSICQKEEEKGCLSRKAAAEQIRLTVTKEIKHVADRLTSMVDEYIAQRPNLDPESQVFVYKLKADYYRYLSEIEEDRDCESTRCAKVAYDKATEVAKELHACNPIRLGLALNASVFEYEIISSPTLAMKRAKDAFDEAIANLDELDEHTYKDSTLIMQLLRDNLTLWAGEWEDEEEKGKVGMLEASKDDQ